MKNRRGTFLLIQSGLERWKSLLLLVSATGSTTGHPGARANPEQLKPARGPAAARSRAAQAPRAWQGAAVVQAGPRAPGGGKVTLWLRVPPGSGRRRAVAPFKITSNAQGWTMGLMDLGVFGPKGVLEALESDFEQRRGKQRRARQRGRAERPAPRRHPRGRVGRTGSRLCSWPRRRPLGGPGVPGLCRAWWGPQLPEQRQLSSPNALALSP